MNTRNFGNNGVAEGRDQLDDIELLRTVDSLRQDILSMSTDIRDVLDENDKLHREIDRLKEDRRGGGVTAARRVKSEVDDLIRIHEMASLGKARSRRAPKGRTHASQNDRTNDSDWMRKMMMFMMMAEMV